MFTFVLQTIAKSDATTVLGDPEKFGPEYCPVISLVHAFKKGLFYAAFIQQYFDACW